MFMGGRKAMPGQGIISPMRTHFTGGFRAVTLYVTLVGLLAGTLGTCLGGFLTCLLRRPTNDLLSIILGFSGGIMIAVVNFDLMPEAIRVGGMAAGIVGLALGVALIAFLDRILPHIHFLSSDRESSRFLRAGVLIGLGIAMHNLPEGMAIGASYSSSEGLGLAVAVIMTIQNLPEGMAMAAPIVAAGIAAWRVAAVTALAGAPMGVGALLGVLASNISPTILSVSLGFAAGAMLFITFDEIIPDAHELASGHTATYGIVLGVVTGVLFSAIISI